MIQFCTVFRLELGDICPGCWSVADKERGQPPTRRAEGPEPVGDFGNYGNRSQSNRCEQAGVRSRPRRVWREFREGMSRFEWKGKPTRRGEFRELSGIALRVIAASRRELAPGHGWSGGSFGKECHVFCVIAGMEPQISRMGTDTEALTKIRIFTRWQCPEICVHLCNPWSILCPIPGFRFSGRKNRPARGISGITGIALRVIAASRRELAPGHGGSGGSFGKECHVLSGRENRRARRFSGIMGIALRVIAASRRELASGHGGSGGSFGKECHVFSGRKSRRSR